MLFPLLARAMRVHNPFPREHDDAELLLVVVVDVEAFVHHGGEALLGHENDDVSRPD